MPVSYRTFSPLWIASKTQVLIVGANRDVQSIPGLVDETHNIVSYISLPEDQSGGLHPPANILDYKQRFKTLIRQHRINEAILPLSDSPSAGFLQILLLLQETGVRLRLVAHNEIPEVYLFPGQTVGKYRLVEFSTPRTHSLHRLVKRLIDILIVLIILGVAWPVFVLVALAIRADSKGPILFGQKRIGRYGKPFTMYKFRSMHEHLKQNEFDESLLDIIKHPDDPRVTRVGRFLRRTSLDELPQLWNVLMGTMSLVGPRPEMPERVQDYVWWQYKRFEVPQGMTGWWQVNGRANRPMHLHTEDDLYYIHHYSLWFDLKILLRTIRVVLTGEGAF